MSSKASARRKLRDEITNRFVPALHQLGFIGPERITGNSRGYMYRRVAPDSIHCLSLQFDKWQLPRFALDLWIEPPDGIGAVMQRGEKVITGQATPRRNRGLVAWLTGCYGTESWFRADRPWWHFLFGLVFTREQQAVSSAIAMLPEIESWWHNPKPTKHITVI